MPDTTTLILLGIVLVVAVVLIVIYNGLVGKRVETQNAWSQIDVQLKRRYDLIPNLIETVKGYAAHEQETFDRVTDARTQAIGANGVAAQAGAENALSQALRGLFASRRPTRTSRPARTSSRSRRSSAALRTVSASPASTTTTRSASTPPAPPVSLEPCRRGFRL